MKLEDYKNNLTGYLNEQRDVVTVIEIPENCGAISAGVNNIGFPQDMTTGPALATAKSTTRSLLFRLNVDYLFNYPTCYVSRQSSQLI